MIFVLILIILFGLGYLYFRKKGGQSPDIHIEFDDRYSNRNEYIRAIIRELEGQGKKVSYKGNSIFLIDGMEYDFRETNISFYGIPVQQTVLKRVKGE